MITRRAFLKHSALSSGLCMIPSFSLAADSFGNIDYSSASDRFAHRKRETVVRLVDLKGKPMTHHSVEIELKKHAFLFGDCNPSMDSMFRQGNAMSERLKVYRKVFSDVLNAVNATCYWSERPRNNMAKTEEYQGEYRYDGFANTVDWANANGLTVKGHPLFWTVPKAIPEWMNRYDYDTQLTFLEVRLRSIVSRFKGKVKLWDAINEMLWEPSLKNLQKRTWPYCETVENMAEYISYVLRICREEDSDARFLINDYGLERNHNEAKQLTANDNDVSAIKQNQLLDQCGREVTAIRQRKRYLELVKRLQDMGCSPAAIGMQGHSGAITTQEQMALYNQMDSGGIPLHITEFWAHDNDFDEAFQQLDKTERENRKAAYVKQYLSNAFAHPTIECFFFWGFMGMATEWKENGSPSYELLPMYDTIRKLIHEEWSTKVCTQTNSNGEFRFTGFLGDYTLRYNLDNKNMKWSVPFALTKESGIPYQISVIRS